MDSISKQDFLDDYERGLIRDIIEVNGVLYGRSYRGDDAPKIVYVELSV